MAWDVMAVVAEDEVRHAALSWDVHAFLMTRLDTPTQRRIVVAQQHALASFRAIRPAFADELGLPDDASLRFVRAGLEGLVAA